MTDHQTGRPDLVQDDITAAIAALETIRQHAPDLHTLAYPTGSAPPDSVVQTSHGNDLSSRIGRPAQAHWTDLARWARHIRLTTCAEQGRLDRWFSGPAGNAYRTERSALPDHLARETLAAQQRRTARGEHTPTPLDPTLGLQPPKRNR